MSRKIVLSIEGEFAWEHRPEISKLFDIHRKGGHVEFAEYIAADPLTIELGISAIVIKPGTKIIVLDETSSKHE